MKKNIEKNDGTQQWDNNTDPQDGRGTRGVPAPHLGPSEPRGPREAEADVDFVTFVQRRRRRRRRRYQYRNIQKYDKKTENVEAA